ncbi:hypothetical protein VJJ74_07905, partial [Parvimonas micra]|uniref:hypothetical protein n=1 Tax=Parvimonas TaxID=543311 RepID=UPI002B484E62
WPSRRINMDNRTVLQVLGLLLIAAALLYGVLELKTRTDVAKVNSLLESAQNQADADTVNMVEAYINAHKAK